MHRFGEMGEKVAKKSENHEIWANLASKILMRGPRQILDQIYKMTPISDLLSYKGSLSVEPSRKEGERKKNKGKETSVEKKNTSGHYSVWAEL